MCWRSDKFVYGTLLVAAAIAMIAAAGCATPEGEVFGPLNQPQSWPRAPQKARIKLVGAIASSADLEAGQTALESFKSAVRGPRPPIKFSGPHLAARGPGQLLAVTDSSGAAVHILDLDVRTHWVINGWGDEELRAPVGAAWVDRRLFITDAARGEIIEFTSTGQHVRSFGKDQVQRPVGICYVPSRGQLYVVDGAAHQLLAFNLEGEVAARYGGPGTEPGHFNFPTHIG
jgi:hypothetical protein